MSSKTTNLNLTKPSEDEFYDINVQNENMDIIDREINGLKQPAYEVSTAMSDLHSGEMITVAFGKIAKAVSTLISHITSKATSSVLGHVKLSDSTSSTSASTAGVAATPKAVKAAYDLANSNTKKLGTTDISGIGDGTVTGAIVNNKEAIEDVSQSLTNLKNPAKGTKGILVNGGSPLSRDFLLVYTLKTTKEANTGASFSINGIKVADLTTRTPNNIIEICGCVRAFKGDIITTHVASAGGYADVYAYC